MMNNAINNKKTDFMNYPIIISNDNFILDGHHRWFLRKTKLNTDVYLIINLSKLKLLTLI